MWPMIAAGVASLASNYLSGSSSAKASSSPSNADGKSGDAFSEAAFGDFIVNGSKGTKWTNFLIVLGGVAVAVLIVKKVLKK